MSVSPELLTHFRHFVWNFYAHHRREFAWRMTHDPYHIAVSEIMLQQTQTARVEVKYAEFLATFPTIQSLAGASLREVLGAWQGLGYNRRGKFLHEMAQVIVQNFDGIISNDPQLLRTLPGIGPYTASSICAFAYNMPTVFIETNIRAVFIHSFFPGSDTVHDKQLLPLIAATIDQENPRDWYYALMDYGAYLKKTVTNPSRKSRHHTVQSKFEGSDRQIRGMILRLLLAHGTIEKDQLVTILDKEAQRVSVIIDRLCQEQLIKVEGRVVGIE
jgi:A/G-specific adenine glycosylase